MVHIAKRIEQERPRCQHCGGIKLHVTGLCPHCNRYPDGTKWGEGLKSNGMPVVDW